MRGELKFIRILTKNIMMSIIFVLILVYFDRIFSFEYIFHINEDVKENK